MTSESLPEQWSQHPPTLYQMKRFFDVLDSSEAIARLQLWEKGNVLKDRTGSGHRPFKMSICGFSTLNYIEDYFKWAILSEGFIPDVTLGGYNQLFQEMIDPQSLTFNESSEICCIFFELKDLLPTEYFSDAMLLQSKEGLDTVKKAIEDFVGMLESVRQRTNAFLLVNDFFSTRLSPYGIADCRQSIYYEKIYALANEALMGGIKNIAHSGILPLNYLIKKYGISNAYDPRLRHLADCRFTDPFMYEIAKGIKSYIRAIRGTIKKVLVLDLDNTLWSGVVGEDGWDGVKIGSDPIGRAFVDFQKAVLELNKRGVILAINSKNNENDALEVFNRREEMILKQQHFALLKINWKDKATNCIEIAKEINIGLDSLVFWDDNPTERLFVQESLEQVEVVQVPEDVSLWADYLRDGSYFDVLQISHEDARRGQMYAENRLRAEAEVKATDIQTFLNSLELKVECRYVCEENIARITSLLGRTNQFNLTTKRYSQKEIECMDSELNCKVMSFSAADKFGSYGIIGVVIIKISEAVCDLDSLLLSCRAMGKGIEDVMIWKVSDLAQKAGVDTIKATYVSTKKNVPIKEFLPDKGFIKTHQNEHGTDYEYDLSTKMIPKPVHVIFTEKE